MSMMLMTWQKWWGIDNERDLIFPPHEITVVASHPILHHHIVMLEILYQLFINLIAAVQCCGCANCQTLLWIWTKWPGEKVAFFGFFHVQLLGGVRLNSKCPFRMLEHSISNSWDNRETDQHYNKIKRGAQVRKKPERDTQHSRLGWLLEQRRQSWKERRVGYLGTKS